MSLKIMKTGSMGMRMKILMIMTMMSLRGKPPNSIILIALEVKIVYSLHCCNSDDFVGDVHHDVYWQACLALIVVGEESDGVGKTW